MGIWLVLGYILGSCRGYVALWREGCDTPLEVFPYSVASLPPADQQALEKGIHIGSDTELARLIEDYLS